MGVDEAQSCSASKSSSSVPSNTGAVACTDVAVIPNNSVSTSHVSQNISRIPMSSLDTSAEASSFPMQSLDVVLAQKQLPSKQLALGKGKLIPLLAGTVSKHQVNTDKTVRTSTESTNSKETVEKGNKGNSTHEPESQQPSQHEAQNQEDENNHLSYFAPLASRNLRDNGNEGGSFQGKALSMSFSQLLATSRQNSVFQRSEPGSKPQAESMDLDDEYAFGAGRAIPDVEAKRRDVSSLVMVYKRVIGKGFQRGMDVDHVKVPEEDPGAGVDEDLQCLPVGWVKHQTSAKSKKKIMAPNGVKFNSLVEVLRRMMPTKIGFRHYMPLQDYYWMFRELLTTAEQRSWVENIRNENRKFPLSIRITDYKQLKKSLGLNACRIKVTTTTYVVIALPVVITYSYEDECAEFHFESKLTSFDKLPKELVKLLPASTGIPTMPDSPSAQPNKKAKQE